MSKIIDVINKYSMVAQGDRVLCALSGGADSVCMTHILAQRAGALGIGLAAAHFSHGLRPKDAESELALCQKLCDSLNIQLFHQSGDTLAFCRQNGVSIEEGARKLRYDFLQATAQKWGATKIATAHNSGDNAETVLLNLIRGAGAQGLRGIPPVRGQFIRPILEMKRSEVERYIAENNLAYVTDPTNSENDYARNKVRNIVMPVLSGINSRAMENINSAAELLRRDEACLTKQAENAAKTAIFTPNRASLEAKIIAREHDAIAARIIMYLCPVALSKAHIDAVLRLCRGNDPSARASLPDGYTASRINTMIFIGKQAVQPPLEPAVLTPDTPIIWGDYEITLHLPQKKCTPSDGGGESYFVRTRLSGDTILTGGGTKTVKKYMIDMKIPQKNRDRIPIVCNNKEIVVVLWEDGCHRGKDKITVTARRIEHEG